MTETNRHADWFVIFRVLFGCLVAFSAIRFFFNGWIHDLYVVPAYHFYFSGFSWVKVAPPRVMYLLFGVLIVCGAGIALNRQYRLSCVVFFLVFTYVELIDVTYYLNHYYLVSLLSFILIFYDSHAPSYSLQNQRVIFFLKLQVSMVYFFGGVNKIETDWLWHAQPLQIWLHANSSLPVAGSWLEHQGVAFVASWASMIFDVSVAFLLWFRRTRFAAYIALVIFHIATAVLFHIGMFPWIMMTAALLFFIASPPIKTFFTSRKKQWMLAPLVLLAVWQVVFPVRHFFYTGNYLWTERGFRFAWNIMLMEKNGVINFGTSDQHGTIQDVAENAYLTPFQIKMMSTQPDLILQFAKHLQAKQSGITRVFAECYVSLNGRRSQLYFDPAINLLTQEDELYKNIRLHSPVR